MVNQQFDVLSVSSPHMAFQDRFFPLSERRDERIHGDKQYGTSKDYTVTATSQCRGRIMDETINNMTCLQTVSIDRKNLHHAEATYISYELPRHTSLHHENSTHTVWTNYSSQTSPRSYLGEFNEKIDKANHDAEIKHKAYAVKRQAVEKPNYQPYRP